MPPEEQEYQDYLEYQEYLQYASGGKEQRQTPLYDQSVTDAVEQNRATEPEGSYVGRFADELTDPTSFKKTLLNAPASAWNALKGMAGAVAELPQNVRNIAADPMGAIERNGIKALGGVGGVAARFNPAGFITGPLYDKALQFADPVNFPSTTAEQDAAKVRGELLSAGAGLGATKALQAGAGGLQRTGAFLREQLGTKVIPERLKTFDEVLTPAQLDKGLKLSGKDVAEIETVAASNRGIVDLPPQESYKAILAKKKAAGSEIGRITEQADDLAPDVPAGTTTRVVKGKDTGLVDAQGQPIMSPDKTVDVPTPAQYRVNTPKADELVAKIADPLERAKAEEFLMSKKIALENEPQFQGSVEYLQRYKSQLGRKNRPQFDKSAADKSPLESDIERALIDDIGDTIDAQASGYKGATGQYREAQQLLPVARRRAAMDRLGKATVPGEVIEGPWASKLNKAVNILAPAAGAVAATSAGPLGMLGAGGLAAAGIRGLKEAGITPASALARAAQGAGGMAGLAKKFAFDPAAGIASSPLRGVLAGGAVEEQFLPRDSAKFDQAAEARFLMETAQTAQAPVAQQLVEKFRKAKRAQDMDTVERLHADMARLFPDSFEPGFGVNQKLFYPDEQAKYMETLEKLSRMGQVDPMILAKQQNAFADPQDRRILPLPGLISKMEQQNRNDAMRYGPQGQRQYDY
jgi:hypothetical protein